MFLNIKLNLEIKIIFLFEKYLTIEKRGGQWAPFFIEIIIKYVENTLKYL